MTRFTQIASGAKNYVIKMATPAPMRTTSKAKLEKIQQKFKNSVDNGKFYEASQMSKTLFYR